ncbi:MAG: serine hydrolase domain-containing protein [Deltaproteobacteria bacterium]
MTSPAEPPAELPEIPALRRLLEEGRATGVAPALAAAVLWRGSVIHASAAGAGPSTWFDLASLTKPLATGLACLRLAELGALRLDDRASALTPSFGRGGKVAITVRQLLEHRSGLAPWRPLFAHVARDPEAGAIFTRAARGERAFTAARERLFAALDDEAPSAPPGAETRYGDLAFLALGRILERLSGDSLSGLFAREVAGRLGVPDVAYFDLSQGPLPGLSIAPTGTERPRPPAPGQEEALSNLPRANVCERPGEVDDDHALCLAGMAGHAGLFGTAIGVARLGQGFLEEAKGARRLARAELARAFATPGVGAERPLAWDRPSGPSPCLGSRLGLGPEGAVGHLGFTGTSLWIDLDRELVVALLTNRVRTGRDNARIRDFRPRFHDALARELA